MDKRLKIILLWIIILVTGVYRHVDASTWSEINPTTPPPSRSGHALAYDNKNNIVIMFGGEDISGKLNDTWIYDLSTDEFRNPNPSNPPPPRSSHSMVYDSENETIVLFGGIDANGELNDTWQYDVTANQWIEKSPFPSPPARSNAAIAYDHVNGVIILFGGQQSTISLGDTWTYDTSTNAWTEMLPINFPSARELSAMDYDLVNQRVVLYGGDDGCSAGGLCNDTWEYDFVQNQWTERIADGDPDSPQARVSHSLSYIGGGKLLLSGGRPNGGSPLDDIWTYDYAANLWIQETITPSPTARIGHEIVYIGGNKALLFGGEDISGKLNDTWIYESQMSLSGPFVLSQTNWSGGETTNKAQHFRDQTGWKEYNGNDLNVAIANSGKDLQIQAAPTSHIDSTDTDFNREGNIKTNTQIVGSGEGAVVTLLDTNGTYPPSGTFESGTIDTSQTSSFGTISWNPATQKGSTEELTTDFDFNTPSEYTLSGAIDVAGGVAKLKPSGIPEEIIPDGFTMGLWHMNEGVGTTTADASVNNNTATINGAAWTQGKFNSGLSFNGNGYVSLPNITTFYDNNFTFEVWFQTVNDSNTKTIYSSGYNGGAEPSRNEQLLIDVTNTSLTIKEYSAANGWHTLSIPINPTDWNFLAVVKTNSTNYDIYLNGGFVNSLSINSNADNFVEDTIGARFTNIHGSYFVGIIDEVAIHSRSLTPGEILTHADGKYPTDGPTVTTQSFSSPVITSWISFIETSTLPANTSIDYQLSNDGVTWMYWKDGSGWVEDPDVPGTNFTPASTVNANISSFPVTGFGISVKAMLLSDIDGLNTPLLDNIRIGYSPFDFVGGFSKNYDFVDSFEYILSDDTQIEVMDEVARLKAPEIIPDGSTMGLWHMNEGLGTTTANASVNNNTGIINGAVWTPDGKFGYGLSFDGNSYVSLPNITTFYDNNFTFEVWFQTVNDSNTKTIYSSGYNGGAEPSRNEQLLIDVTNTSLTIKEYSAANGWHTLSIPINPTDWNFLAVVKTNSTNYDIYLNGGFVNSLSINSNADNFVEDTIGARFTNIHGSYFVGIIDEVAIHSRVLTPDEILTHFEGKYSTAGPTVTTQSFSSPVITSWFSFIETSTLPADTSIDYQLSNDDGANWMYWDGSGWVPAGTNFTPASTVNANISSFTDLPDPIDGIESISVKARLLSDIDGLTTPLLDNIRIGYDYDLDLVSETLAVEVRAGNTSIPDAAWTGWQAVTNGSDIPAILDGKRYIRYKAAFTTPLDNLTPRLSDITINYTNDIANPQELISSPYNSRSTSNFLQKINWTEDTPLNTSVKFQIRTALDTGGMPDFDSGSGWIGPDGTGNTYFESINCSKVNKRVVCDIPRNIPISDGAYDQWFQYRAILQSTDGINTPTLSDVTTTYLFGPVVTGVNPSTGVNTTDTSITITGTALAGATSGALFDVLDELNSAALTNFSVVDDSTITAVVPSGLLTGSYDVRVTTDVGTNIESSVNFDVTGEPRVTGVAPSSGNNDSVTNVTISGDGFTGATSVGLDDPANTAMVNLNIVDDDTITATVPSGIATGSYNIIVTTPGGSNTTSTIKFDVTGMPGVTGIAPLFGNNTSATDVTISGDGFTGASSVRLNDPANTAMVNVNVVDDDTITATVPAGIATGTYNIIVTTPGGSNTTSTIKFDVTGIANVTQVTPDSWENTTSVTVTMIGNGFTRASSVRFDDPADTVLLNLNVINDDTLTATVPVTVPAITTGTYNIIITTPAGENSTSSAKFMVTPPILDISPDSLEQGTTNRAVRIVWVNFKPDSTISYSGSGISINKTIFHSQYEMITYITITNTAPTTKRTVTITNPDGAKATGIEIFTVLPSSPVTTTVTSIDPDKGEQGISNLDIIINGTNFQDGASVSFSNTGISVNSTTFISDIRLDTNISIDAGASEGPTDITATNPDTTSGTGIGLFTVVPPQPLSITDVNPSRGLQDSTIDIAVHGTGFQDGAGIAFSGTGITLNPDSLNVINDTQINANITISSGAPTGDRDIIVTNPGGESVSDIFTVVPPPSGIDISKGIVTSTSVELIWIAPDIGINGMAQSYDIRYSASPIIDDVSWDSAIQVANEPVPLPPGSPQSFIVTGLTSNTIYYFAIRSMDIMGKLSLSPLGTCTNCPITTKTPDDIPPSPINDLVTGAVSENSVQLLWTATGDDGDTGIAASYDIRYSIIPIVENGEGNNSFNIDFDKAWEASGELQPESPGTPESFTVSGLNIETTYYFAIKVLDEKPNASPINTNGCTSPNPNVNDDEGCIKAATSLSDEAPPSAVNDLHVVPGGITDISIALQWTAPGDNGEAGTASSYDLRYSLDPITDANFDSAIQVIGLQRPRIAGSNEQFIITGLSPQTPYYFAIKTSDEVPNISGISNILSATTLSDTTIPEPITDLQTGTTGDTFIELLWTAPGDPKDDGTRARVSTYDIRYSIVPVVKNGTGNNITNIDFDKAWEVADSPIPGHVDSPEKFAVTSNPATLTGSFSKDYDFSDTQEYTLSDPPGEIEVAGGAARLLKSGATEIIPDADGSTAGLWHMNEGFGTTTANASVNNNTGIINGAVWTPDGKFGYGLSFDGNSYVSLPNITTFYDNNFTFEVWFQTVNDSNTKTIYSSGYNGGADPSRNEQLLIDVTNTSLTIKEYSAANGWHTLSIPINPTDWNFLAVVKTNSTNYDIYLNGGFVNSLSINSNADNFVEDTIGARFTNIHGSYFVGIIDEVAIHSRPLTPDEILSHAQGKYPTTGPTVTTNLPFSSPAISSWISFTETSTLPANTSIDYQLSNDGVNWMYWDGSVWVEDPDVPGTNFTSASTVNANISSFPVTGFGISVKARLSTDGSDTPSLDNIRIGYDYDLGTETGLTPGVKYYFAIKSIDETGNVSPINTGVDTPVSATTITGDIISPSVITYLNWLSSTQDSVTIQWTAPGDDGDIGKATLYDIRYSTQGPISELNFYDPNVTTPVPTPPPLPLTSGRIQSLTIVGLTPDTDYWFAIVSIDNAANTSPVGSCNNCPAATATLPDTISPSPISDLQATSETTNSITLQWSAPGDDGNTGTADSYDLRYSTDPITNDTEFNAAVSASGLPAPQIADTPETFTITGLNSDTIYYFAIKTMDEVPNISPINTNLPVSGRTLLDTIPPDNITDLQVDPGSERSYSLMLKWTATGDDGSFGTADKYDLRYSTTPIANEVDFSNSTQIAGRLPQPQPAGIPETFTVTGLSSNSIYYFAIKVTDDNSNSSGVSSCTNCPARTALRPGDNMVSVPLQPVPNSIIAVFGDDVGTPVNIVKWFSTGLGPMDGYYIVPEPAIIKEGEGYFLITPTDNAVIDAPDGSPFVTDTTYTIDLHEGWNIIGNPYSSAVQLDDSNTTILKVEDGTTVVLSTAISNGWIGNAIYYYNGATYNVSFFNGTPPATLEIWKGYWLQVLDNSFTYKLIITKP